MTIKPEEVTANFIVSVNKSKTAEQTPASRQTSLQNTIKVLQDIEARGQGKVSVDIVPVVEALIDATPEMEDVGEVVVSIDEKSKRDVAMLERGQMPEIKIRDAHEELIVAADVHYKENEAMYPEEVRQMFEDYAKKHMAYITSRSEVVAMKQQAMAMMGAAGGGSTPGAGGATIPPTNPDNGEQAGLPENRRSYNLNNIVAAGGQ